MEYTGGLQTFPGITPLASHHPPHQLALANILSFEYVQLNPSTDRGPEVESLLPVTHLCPSGTDPFPQSRVKEGREQQLAGSHAYLTSGEEGIARQGGKELEDGLGAVSGTGSFPPCLGAS